MRPVEFWGNQMVNGASCRRIAAILPFFLLAVASGDTKYVTSSYQDLEETDDGRVFVVSLKDNLVTLSADAPKRGLRGITDPGWRMEITVVNGGNQPFHFGQDQISVRQMSNRDGDTALKVFSEDEAVANAGRRKSLIDGALIVGSSVVGGGIVKDLDPSKIYAAQEVLDTLGEVISSGMEISGEKLRVLTAQYQNTMLRPMDVGEAGHTGGYVLVAKPSRRASGAEIAVTAGPETHIFAIDLSR